MELMMSLNTKEPTAYSMQFVSDQDRYYRLIQRQLLEEIVFLRECCFPAEEKESLISSAQQRLKLVEAMAALIGTICESVN